MRDPSATVLRGLALSVLLASAQPAWSNEMAGPWSGDVTCVAINGGGRTLERVNAVVADGRLSVAFARGEATGRIWFGRTFHITGSIARPGAAAESVGFQGWFNADGTAYGRGSRTDASCELRLTRAVVAPPPRPVARPVPPPEPIFGNQPRPVPNPAPPSQFSRPPAPPPPIVPVRPATAPPPAQPPGNSLPDMLACSLAGTCPPVTRR